MWLNAKTMLVTAKRRVATRCCSRSALLLLLVKVSAPRRLPPKPSSPLPFTPTLHPIDRPRPFVVHHPSLRKTTPVTINNCFLLRLSPSLVSFVQQSLLCSWLGSLGLGLLLLEECPRCRSFVPFPLLATGATRS